MFEKTKLKLAQPIRDVGNVAMGALFIATMALIVAFMALGKKG